MPHVSDGARRALHACRDVPRGRSRSTAAYKDKTRQTRVIYGARAKMNIKENAVK